MGSDPFLNFWKNIKIECDYCHKRVGVMTVETILR